MPQPSVQQGPDALARLARGFIKLTSLLALTLGPTQGHILSQRDVTGQADLLTDAATIARRILALPDRVEDVGAMLARNLVWRQRQRMGDGSATTAVLAQALLEQALRYRAAGGNVMLMRRGIDRAARAACDALNELARPISSMEDLVHLTQTVTGEPSLGDQLAQIYLDLGEQAYVIIEEYVAPYLDRRYYRGGRWVGRLASPYLITDAAARRALLDDALIALVAGPLSTIEQVQPLLEIASRGNKRLVLAAFEITGAALTALVMNHRNKALQIVAVELRRPESKRQIDLQDLAALTGAEVLDTSHGRAIERVREIDLGHVPHIEADAEEVVIVGDPARPEAQKTMQVLSARLAQLPPQDEEREEIEMRLARLTGQIAKLLIGAHTETERSVLKQKAEQALRAVPIGLREGILPGGGVAFLQAIPAALAVGGTGDEGFGVQALARALEEPFRRIVLNGGGDAPGVWMEEARRAGPEYGYDVLQGRLVSMYEAGIVDSAGVLQQALMTAVSGAVMALTTDAIILKRNPVESIEP